MGETNLQQVNGNYSLTTLLVKLGLFITVFSNDLLDLSQNSATSDYGMAITSDGSSIVQLATDNINVNAYTSIDFSSIKNTVPGRPSMFFGDPSTYGFTTTTDSPTSSELFIATSSEIPTNIVFNSALTAI